MLAALVAVSLPGPVEAEEAGATEILVLATPLGEPGVVLSDARAIAARRDIGIAEALARTAPGVNVNEMQGNPLQADITYHGFTASPLLGTPQGLSVYLDGVRINQSFGDVVSWDLIPASIVASIDLVPGASPQFGRNALGGALALRTRDGRSDPGVAADVGLGSFGRFTANARTGGSADNGVHWLVSGDHFRENGWRDLSPSRASHGFAKLGWADGQSDVALSGMFADTDLNGNGLQEMRLLHADRTSIYTAPDNTRNRAWLANLKGGHRFSDRVSFSGNLFWRRIRTATYNGDINDEALGQSLYQPSADEQVALLAAGYSGFPLAGESQDNTPFPRWRCIANVLLNEEPNEKCNGLVNRSRTVQSEWGGGAELVFKGPIAGIEQSLTLGLSHVNSRANFGQDTQFGFLLADRTVSAVAGPGAFADGTQASEDAFDARVDLHSRTASLGIYLLESARLTDSLRLDLAGRFDRTAIHNRDRITPGGGTGSLSSDPVFESFNPSVAVNWNAAPGADLAVSWSQASRAPSAIELGCSDPESPCRLPNALAGDPPLRQVIARTLVARASLSRSQWSLAVSAFSTQSHDDILFVSDDISGFGYFRNFGRTRRQGIEVQGDARLGRWTLDASYTFLNATFRSPETVGGAANSSNDAGAPGFEGSIKIAPGDRLPLVPRHLFKAQLAWAPREWISLNLDMVAVSGAYARGNENNQHQPDGIHTLGPGRSGGYAVFNLGGEIQAARWLSLYATVRNLLGTRYATAAQLGPTGFDAGGRFVARPFAGPVIDGERPLLSSTFMAPGAPRSVQFGARLRF